MKDNLMPELNYLKQDKKLPGHAPFITYVDFQVEHGKADMWLYDIFPGMQMMVSDFNTDSCFRGSDKQNVIGINHCKKGRFECEFRSRQHIYLGEGDIAINNELHQPVSSAFPLNRFYGTTILLFPEIMDTVPELQAFGIQAEKLSQKYNLNTIPCHIFRRDEAIEHVYDELYQSLKEPDLPFLRLKVLELLYHFQFRQALLEEKREYLSGTVVEKIKHVKEHLVREMEQHIGLRELAMEHGLSLTQLKDGFKQIYGESPYAYLRSYKMNLAAQYLRETERKIGEIALELGYQNPSKFSEAFYAVMGQRPMEYRKQNRK